MKKSWIVITAQWLVVLLYAKFGYYAEGESAEHWARFFSVSNQAITCFWIYFVWKRRLSEHEIKMGLLFNALLAVLWMQHYIPFINYYVEVCKNGIFVPILGYIVICLCLNIILDKKQL